MRNIFPASSSNTGRPAPGRLALIGALLLALLFQGYATQTHIHPRDSTAPIASQDGDSPGHKNLPPNDDPARCPVCQQIAQAGQYVAPAWLMPLLVLQAVAAIEIATVARPDTATISHNWRSRGPPQA